MYKILVLPGDGIGPEVTGEAVKILRAVGKLAHVVFETAEMSIGGASIDQCGVSLRPEVLETAKQCDAVLLGAVGGAKWDSLAHSLRPEQALLGLRAGLDLYANLRPAVIDPSLLDASTLKREVVEGVDLLVVRELVGGIYFGQPRGIEKTSKGAERGFNTEVYTTPEIERIAHRSFELARKRRRKLMSVDKANILESSIVWRKVVTGVGQQYPDVELSHMYVDNCAMQLIRDPKQFDVIVTNNMFGDILSDAAAMLTGSIGMLPSASLGTKHALYEPVHGSAPDIAGKGLANPMAAILSAAMMLRYSFNLMELADAVEAAVRDVLKAGFRTADLAGGQMKRVSTSEMGDRIAERIRLK